MQSTQVQQQKTSQSLAEEILVVPRSVLFKTIAPWYGIEQTVFDTFTTIIQDEAHYMPRALAETDPKYKQIIPYVLFTYNQMLFVMQRKSTASEQRLASKFSLGIGGHIREADIQGNNILSWADREFEEEVAYEGTLTTKKIGILNDDTSDVGKVHLGVILLVTGTTDQITIKDEHKNGTLLTLEECQKLYDNMENWSKICFDFILQHQDLLK